MAATALREREDLNPWVVVTDSGAALTPNLAHIPSDAGFGQRTFQNRSSGRIRP